MQNDGTWCERATHAAVGAKTGIVARCGSDDSCAVHAIAISVSHLPSLAVAGRYECFEGHSGVRWSTLKGMGGRFRS